MIMLEQTIKFKTSEENEAIAAIEAYKAKSIEEPYQVTKASYVKKEKKSKGEVIDAWVVGLVTLKYDEEN